MTLAQDRCSSARSETGSLEVKQEAEWDDVSSDGGAEFSFSSSRGQRMLVKNGYAYRNHRHLGVESHLYRCVVTGCRGGLSLSGKRTHVRGTHNHAPDPAQYEMRLALSNIMSRASLAGEPLKKIIQEERAKMSVEAFARLPKLGAIKQSLLRRKRNLRRLSQAS